MRFIHLCDYAFFIRDSNLKNHGYQTNIRHLPLKKYTLNKLSLHLEKYVNSFYLWANAGSGQQTLVSLCTNIGMPIIICSCMDSDCRLMLYSHNMATFEDHLDIGLSLNSRPSHSPVMLPPCRICSEKASGFHYGVNTCEACKVVIEVFQILISFVSSIYVMLNFRKYPAIQLQFIKLHHFKLERFKSIQWVPGN